MAAYHHVLASFSQAIKYIAQHCMVSPGRLISGHAVHAPVSSKAKRPQHTCRHPGRCFLVTRPKSPFIGNKWRGDLPGFVSCRKHPSTGRAIFFSTTQGCSWSSGAATRIWTLNGTGGRTSWRTATTINPVFPLNHTTGFEVFANTPNLIKIIRHSNNYIILAKSPPGFLRTMVIRQKLTNLQLLPYFCVQNHQKWQRNWFGSIGQWSDCFATRPTSTSWRASLPSCSARR